MRTLRLAAVLLAACLAAAPHRAAAADPTDTVEELNFYNTDLHLVLKALAEKTGYAFIEDIPVEGKVTIHIAKKTALPEVLDQLLRGLNLSWRLEKGVYHVQLKARAPGERLGSGLTTRTFPLTVIPADDGAEAARPMLSEYGKVIADAGLNAITVTDVPEVLDSVKTMLDGLDKEGLRPAQINIQTKVLQIDHTGTGTTGATLEWHKANAFESLASNYLPMTLNNVQGWGNQYLASTVNNVRQEGQEYYAYYPEAMTFKVGHWGIDGLVARFMAAQTDASVNVLSEPDVSVASDTEAHILVGARLPVAINGGFEWNDTGISLKVKPKLGEEGRIYMELAPSVTEQTGEVANGRDFLNNREITTNVEVNSGDTIRVGGLVYTSVRKTEHKLPVLGDLPLIGTLFRRTNASTVRQEVVILVSPHIVERIPPRCATTAGISALGASLVVGTTDVLLDWSEDVPFDNVGVVRYHVYRDVAPIVSTAGLTPISREVRGDVTSWVDFTPKRRGVTYWYAVTAIDGAGNEEAVSNSPSASIPRR